MKKLKTIFSPRKIALWLFILLLVLTLPNANKPAMSQTSAIVTMMCVDETDSGQIGVAVSVLSPSDGKTAKYDVYSGEGDTLGEAVSNIALAVGKDIGFAQCEILGIGDNLSESGVMKVLDFMTRTKKVGRNTTLINASGDSVDFVNAVTTLAMNKSLKIEKIINYDERYFAAADSNVETFYIGYYSDISLGIMPIIKLSTTEEKNAIEVSASSSQGTSQSNNASGESSEGKKYLVNDGSMCVFKKGKKYLEIDSDMVDKLNFFLNESEEGSIVVEGVSDHLYDNAKVTISIVKKSIKVKPIFDGDTPVYKSEIDLTVFVEEVGDNTPEVNMLKRNRDFITPELIKKIKEKVSEDMKEVETFSKVNKVDTIDAYMQFNTLKHKQFKKYLERVGIDNYLDGMRFETTINIRSEY